MRAHIIGTGLVLGLAVTAFSSPFAWADNTDNTDNTGNHTKPFLAAPGEPLAPGQELQIQGYCPDPAAGTITSGVLTGITMLHDPESGSPNLNASGVVAEGTEPGVYTASMDCAGQVIGVRFTVIEPQDPAPDLPDFVRVYPASAHPGDPVAAQAACEADEATLTSPVLHTVILATDPEGHQPWALHGSTTVTEDATPGEYSVVAQCSGSTLETTFTVLGGPTDGKTDTDGKTGTDGKAGTDGKTGTDGKAGTDGKTDQVSRVPRGAPETGEGIEEVSAGQHVSVPLLVLGVAIGAAAGAGAIVWREVRR